MVNDLNITNGNEGAIILYTLFPGYYNDNCPTVFNYGDKVHNGTFALSSGGTPGNEVTNNDYDLVHWDDEDFSGLTENNFTQTLVVELSSEGLTEYIQSFGNNALPNDYLSKIVFTYTYSCARYAEYLEDTIFPVGPVKYRSYKWNYLSESTYSPTYSQSNPITPSKIVPHGYNFLEDSYNFRNIKEKIALEYYTGLYGTEKGTELYNFRGEKEKHGHCFGMATSTAATLINAPYVTDYISWSGLPYTKLSSVNRGTMNIDMDISAKDYIKYCHIYQDSAFVAIQRNSDNHNGIQNVYNAVKHAVLSNTDCTLIVIDLWGGSGGHTVYAAGIDGNDILVNDSNAPGSIQRIKINGNNWSYSAGGLNWNSSVDATIGYVENCIEPYLRLTMGIDVEGGNVPKSNSNSYSYTEESEINGTYSYTSTVIEPIDTDKLLVVSENDNFSFDESESMYKLNSTDGTVEENANGLYWLDGNNTINAVNTSDSTATIKLVGNELKITAEMPADSSIKMTIDENENNEASFRLKEEENISFTFTTLDENNKFVNIVITGTADTTEVTANQTESGLSVSGISNGTVSLTQNDETVSSQQITNADGEIEITYDKNGENDTMIVDYQQPHTHSDENKDGICDTCGEDFTKDCSCMCHSNSFVQFIHKVLCFFYKLFGMNDYRYCDCGKAHW